MVKYLSFHVCFHVFFLSLFISTSSCLYAQDNNSRRFSYQLGIKVDPMGTQGKLTKGKSGKKMEMNVQKDSNSKETEEKVPKGAYAQAMIPEPVKKQKKGK